MHDKLQTRNCVDEELRKTERLINEMERRLEELPRGSLCAKGAHIYRQYYENGRRRQVAIAEGYDDRERLIAELCDRRYIAKALPLLRANMLLCRRFLGKYRVYDPQQIREAMPKVYRDHDFGHIRMPGYVDPKAWAAERYMRNELHPEKKIYRSEGGVWVRSKAEADIATKLEQSGLAFRYEEMIRVGTRRLSPDFSILHPAEGRVKYWEHFGMMDDPQYAASAMEKLCHYAYNGIRAGEELIITWETGANPLLFDRINACIERYLKQRVGVQQK